MVDSDRLRAAYETARCDLLAESATQGRWLGELQSSAYATAAAISALAQIERQATHELEPQRERLMSERIMAGVRWLARRQNPDGGWSDQDHRPSELSTTLLVRAAFGMTCVPADCPGLLERADAWIAKAGGATALARCPAQEKTLSAAVLTHCAIAGLIPWRKVPALPFARSTFPSAARRMFPLSVPGDYEPLVIAVGLARWHHAKPIRPLPRWVGGALFEESLQRLSGLCSQPLSATCGVAMTGFIVTSLASMGRHQHPLVRCGIDNLLDAARDDGSWPPASAQNVRSTASAVEALASAGEEPGEPACMEWLLRCQLPDADGQLGGWGPNDSPHALPTVDDTAHVLQALAAWLQSHRADTISAAMLRRVHLAAIGGVEWLLDKRTEQGGWSEGASPSDECVSETIATAQAVRALCVWRQPLAQAIESQEQEGPALAERMKAGIAVGLAVLTSLQKGDGAWRAESGTRPLLTGADDMLRNTTDAIAAFRAACRSDCPTVDRAVQRVLACQHSDGSWSTSVSSPQQTATLPASLDCTSRALEALQGVSFGMAPTPADTQAAIDRGLKWLIDAIEANKHQQREAAGFRWNKIWMYERLQPLISAVRALGQAMQPRQIAVPESAPRQAIKA